MDFIQQLTNEHLDVLAMANILEKGEEIKEEDRASILDFLQVFVDKCHHGKEEEILFPAMEKAGVPKVGLIDELLKEHEEGREFVRNMAGEDFAENAREYASLIREHIKKEQQKLFPLALQKIPIAEREQLLKEFVQFEAQEIGEGKHEEFRHLIEVLKNSY